MTPLRWPVANSSPSVAASRKAFRRSSMPSGRITTRCLRIAASNASASAVARPRCDIEDVYPATGPLIDTLATVADRRERRKDTSPEPTPPAYAALMASSSSPGCSSKRSYSWDIVDPRDSSSCVTLASAAGSALTASAACASSRVFCFRCSRTSLSAFASAPAACSLALFRRESARSRSRSSEKNGSFPPSPVSRLRKSARRTVTVIGELAIIRTASSPRSSKYRV